MSKQKKNPSEITYKKLTLIVAAVSIAASMMTGLIIKGLDIWEQADYVPKKQMHYIAAELYQKNRNEKFREFTTSWTKMRVLFSNYIDNCKMLNEQERKKISKEQKKMIDDIRADGTNISYYFGRKIDQITRSEYNWYIKNIGVCPKNNRINRELLHRQKEMELYMLKKMFQPQN